MDKNMKKEPACVARTLAWCNRQRKKQNKQPLKRLPKGKMSDPYSCPCGAATGLSVGLYTFHDPKIPFQNKKLPKGVREFVCQFDNGVLPQYIIGAAF
jgi:hypothetical protein